MSSKTGSVRIIGGQWRSRIITFPAHIDLRPTPDRVRETLFNWLGQDLTGLSCLDLFAGSGVLGFEAGSRGAAQVVMIESSHVVYTALTQSKIRLKADAVELVRMDTSVFLATDNRKFDIVFLDPPYRMDLLPRILPLLAAHLTQNGLVYLETERHCKLDSLIEHWQIRRKGKAGKVNYHLLEIKPELA